MALPYDGWSVAAIAGALLCFVAASRKTIPTHVRLALIVLAALLIRVDPAWQISLHLWDESVHALVAKHLVSHPLTPTLYDHPVLPMPLDDWTEAEIWLHKPPLALWLMAGSLATWGTHALALRVPSLLLSTLGVLVTYAIGRRVFDVRIGLLAASFQAVNGLLVALSSGRRVADHVDTAVACVQLGILAIVAGTDDRRAARGAWLAGIAMGLGVLAKSLPALIVAAVAGAAWVAAFGPRRAMALLARFAFAALLVCGPWIAYARLAFPGVAERADAYTLRHITTVVENHGGPAWSYLQSMPHFFGELVYVPVVWFLVAAARHQSTPWQRAIAIWMVVPYVVFSIMATKLAGFIAIAAPAVFLAEAAAWIHWRDGMPAVRGRFMRRAGWTALALVAILPARYLLERTGAFERRDRHAPATRQLMELDQTLGLTTAVIFNVPRPFELMFYSRYVAYDRMPRPEDVAKLRARAIPIVIYQPFGTTVTPPADWNARVLEGR